MNCSDNQIKFSIIIPHKNTPEYLQRCLDSIPNRDDVQVIVVDDNSDADKVDFDKFPKWKGSHYEYYLTKDGRGAGYARNIGLEHAEGKWLLFADADDFMLPVINQLFDEYVDSEADIIFFRPKSVMADDVTKPSNRTDYLNDIADDYIKNGNAVRFLYNWLCPWSKIIRHDMVRGVKFEEIRYSNDNVYSVTALCNARKVSVSDTTFYVATRSQDSLTSQFMSREGEAECRIGAYFRSFRIVKSCNKDCSCMVTPLKNFTQMMHYRNWQLYIEGLRLCNSVGIGTWQMLQAKYAYAGRWDRWKGYVNTCLHIFIGK
ncbi:MAG: glycosyltransferase [Bacteroidales bacterium]|nr:glycosyltransferase [Bacteroidales bacterium]